MATSEHLNDEKNFSDLKKMYMSKHKMTKTDFLGIRCKCAIYH